MPKPILCALAALIFFACAKKPDQIATTKFDDDIYSRHSCSKLAAEGLKQEQNWQICLRNRKQPQSNWGLWAFIPQSQRETDFALYQVSGARKSCE